MSKFVPIQQDILDSTASNQLVSAGAGSGKTTVMIEKIANLLLNDNVDVDNLLVVTFTVLAAGEMKDRLKKKMYERLETSEDKAKILNLIDKIETASIDTIDGFSSKTIKKYFYDLEISPNIEIISDATRDYYLTRAMKRTIDQFSRDADKINILLDLFGGNRRNLDAIEELAMNTYHNIMNIDDYEEFLDEALLEYKDSIKSENVINQHMCYTAYLIRQKIIESFSTFDAKVKEKLNNIISALDSLNSKMSFITNLQSLNAFDLPSFSVKECKENVGLKELNREINKIIEIKKNLEKNQINENFNEKNIKITQYLNVFLEFLKNFIKNYNKLKEKNNLIDFNDLNRLMLKLLKNENIRKELQQKYKYIFIDEYQDVNPLQDGLMSSLVGEDTNVFMVGDVKQSIYGFRGSSPEWFLNKYNGMKKIKGDKSVFDMNVNFRSNPRVLNFINDIFSKLMTVETADIDYAHDCMIEPKRDDILDDKVKIMLVKESRDEDVDYGVYSVKNHQGKHLQNAKEMQAGLVVKIITELIGTPFYDANLKTERNLTYKDIAILSRSEKDEKAKILIDMLKDNAIPLNLTNKLDVTNSEGISLVLSILRVIIGNADDLDYLATFNSLTDIDIDQIVSIRDKEKSFYENLVENKEKDNICIGFEKINSIKKASYTRTNKELIRYILDDMKLRYFILRKPNGEKELRQVEEFVSKLSTIEDSLGLAEFVEVIESNVSKASDFSSQDSEDSVTIQTIHKSKGLEYPVVILYNSSKIFSYLRDTDSINFNADIGLGIDYFDTADRVKMDSLTKYAIKIKNNQKGYKEELRLLYVALTRAKNKLYILGNYTDKLLSEDISKNSYANMILACYQDRLSMDGLETENCKIELIDSVDIDRVEEVDVERSVEMRGLDFEYPHREKFNIPLKNSVTGINSASVEEKGFSTKMWLKNSTQYDAEDRAKIGTHYHTAMEMLDLSTMYVKNTDFLDVDYDKIRLAHKVLSPLVKDAIDIKKEAEFMMYVPYNELVDSAVTDKVLVQGVVDLLIENKEDIVIVDYKFSRLPIRLLKEKYAEQLKLYKLAVEKAYNKKVAHMYIYSIETGELL